MLLLKMILTSRQHRNHPFPSCTAKRLIETTPSNFNLGNQRKKTDRMYLGLLAKIVSYFWPHSTECEGSATRPVPTTGMTCMICAHSMHFNSDSKIVFIIGAPGTGKGTQSDFLVNRYGLQHLSYGDLMRGLRERGDPVVSRLETKPGTNNPNVPDGLGVWYIWQELHDGAKGGKEPSWLIDGFPRREAQVTEWLKMIPRADVTLYLKCPVEVSSMRVAARGAKAGAEARLEDLDPDVAMRRIQEFYKNADRVVAKLRERGMTVVEVDTNRSEREIQADLERIMDPLMKKQV